VRRAAPALLALGLILALAGCETTAEKSAKIEPIAKAAAARRRAAEKGLTITHPSRVLAVTQTAIVHDNEGSAAVVTLRNTSGRALRDVPIAITARDAKGTKVYDNSTPGLAPSLVSAPLIEPHGSIVWVNDQVTGAGTPTQLNAEVGEGEPVSGAVPQLTASGSLSGSEGATAEGTVVEQSGAPQRELVVYAVAERAGKIVAAGRAIVPVVEPGISGHFQIFLIGNPAGAKLRLTAPPTTFG
jgi:hypothetical protein